MNYRQLTERQRYQIYVIKKVRCCRKDIETLLAEFPKRLAGRLYNLLGTN